jgi:hypothetical protein
MKVKLEQQVNEIDLKASSIPMLPTGLAKYPLMKVSDGEKGCLFFQKL